MFLLGEIFRWGVTDTVKCSLKKDSFVSMYEYEPPSPQYPRFPQL